MKPSPSLNLLSQAHGWLLLGAVACYGVAMLLLWAHLFARQDEERESGRAWHEVAELSSLCLLFVGANLNALSLLGQGSAVWSERAGVAGVFGCVLVAAYLGWRHKVGQSTLGAFIAPVAFGAALFSLASPKLQIYVPVQHLGSRPLESQWLVVHVLLILCGYVALAFAFAASVIYLVQDGLLKRKKLSGLWQRLPSLSVADEVIERATRLGLLLLSLGLAIGLAWAIRHASLYAFWRDPKVLFSLATWLIFAGYVGARAALGWRGRRTNLVVVYGFLLLVISFLGAPHIVPGR